MYFKMNFSLNTVTITRPNINLQVNFVSKTEINSALLFFLSYWNIPTMIYFNIDKMLTAK